MTVALTRMEGAACRGMDLDLFFGADGESSKVRPVREAEAKRVCAGCPVVQSCLDEALIGDIRYGVWGGTTPEEREEVRSRLVALGDLPERERERKERPSQRRRAGAGECAACGTVVGLTGAGRVSLHGRKDARCVGSLQWPANATAVAS